MRFLRIPSASGLNYSVFLFRKQELTKTQEGKSLSEDDVESLDLIYGSMEVRMRSLGEEASRGEPPARYPTVPIKVRVLDPASGEEIHNLRVQYVTRALFSKRDENASDFPGFSSPSQHKIPEANYNVWAERDDAVLTDVVTLKARAQQDGEAMELDLMYQPE